jgi:hypothetical protein
MIITLSCKLFLMNIEMPTHMVAANFTKKQLQVYILPRRSSTVVFDFSSLLDTKLSKRSNRVDRLPDDKADNKFTNI